MKLSLSVASALALGVVAADAARSVAPAHLGTVADVTAAFSANILASARPAPAAKASLKKSPKISSTAATAHSFIPGAYMVEFDAEAPLVRPMDHIIDFLKGRNSTAYNKKTITGKTAITTSLFHGQSFVVHSEHDTADLLAIPGAKKVTPVRVVKRPAAASKSPAPAKKAVDTDITPHAMTGVADVHASGHTGKGIKIAVIDTGVYYLHPALGGGFGPGFKVSFGEDFVGDDYTSTNNLPVPDNDPLDNCSSESHGTHCAGIIGADASAITTPGFIPALPWVGVAPGAELGAFRVFGCGGDSGNDIITKAVYHAFEQGADVISMSLGSPGVIGDGDSLSDAIARVTRAGVHVVVAAGNEGDAGMFSIGSPSDAPAALSVASWDNHAQEFSQIIGADGAVYPYVHNAVGGPFKNDPKYQIVVADPTDACVTKTYATVGKALLVKYGAPAAGGAACGTSVMCGAALAQNASACLIYNLPAGANGNVGIPGAYFDAATATALLASLKANPTALFEFSEKQGLRDAATAGTASDFSAWGTDVELHMKPDIAGPGGNIYSTISPHAASVSGLTEDYIYMSGTSMATPYLAGSVALYLEQKGKSSTPERTFAALRNSGQITPVYNTTLRESPIRAGGGLIQINNAIKAQTLITPSFLALNDTIHIKPSYTFNVKNSGKKAVSYTLKHLDSGLATPFAKGNDMPLENPIRTAAPATVSLSHTAFTLQAGKSIDITAKFTAPTKGDASLFPIYGGYIQVQSGESAAPVQIPYMGMKGNFKNVKMMVQSDPVGNAVTNVFDSNMAPIVAGSTVNATLGLNILQVLAQSTRVAFVDVILASGNLPGLSTSFGVIETAAGNAYTPNAPRNIDSTSPQSYVVGGNLYQWHGAVTLQPSTTAGVADEMVSQLPAGNNQYKIRFTSLKHFGDSSKPADYEVVTSPAFKIVY
ncbi:hypothetical protein HKX48_002653 [Thoreauomyces humboldtii]|nr:hypothetical protein HKX48_002653 [Thoreauomyces humboldtii]